MFADYHMHCEFSDDSEYLMEDVVKDAIRLGLNEICFTDHVDYGIKRDWDDPRGVLTRPGGPGEPEEMAVANVDYPKYLEKLSRMQELYGDQITIKRGLEFGMQRHTVALYESLYERYPLDFIILSVHEVEDQEFWNGAFQQGKTQDEIYQSYYGEILTLVKNFKHYSVLGHLDLISRYDEIGNYPFEKIKPILTEILRIVIRDGKGIEINTSSKRYGLVSTPSLEILKLYHDLGGTIVTVGSDSHKKEHLGVGIQDAYHLLKEIGFTHICTFEQMQPVFHLL